MHLRTLELCKIAIQKDSIRVLFGTPLALLSDKLFLFALRHDKENDLPLESIPKEFHTLEVCKAAVANNPDNLDFVPTEFLQYFR